VLVLREPRIAGLPIGRKPKTTGQGRFLIDTKPLLRNASREPRIALWHNAKRENARNELYAEQLPEMWH
jgi:hypothetical protein